MNNQKTDVAINIFGRPFQTSLSLLSLIKQSGALIDTIWLQYEPVGMKEDVVTALCIYEYLKEQGWKKLKIYQSANWLKNNYITLNDFQKEEIHSSIRYQYAFENTNAEFLLLIHSDIFVKKDLISALKNKIYDFFGIGQIGQCWNCPAHHPEIAQEVMHCNPCTSTTYLNFRPTYEELKNLYQLAEKKGIFVRPYHIDNFSKEFLKHPWPLPECRINEWSCLINMKIAKPATMPYGTAWPLGAYQNCGKYNLDIGVSWFRDMNNKGYSATNIDLNPLITHWIGTGSNTPRRYALRELNAFKLLERHFTQYIKWLRNKYPAEIKTMLGE